MNTKETILKMSKEELISERDKIIIEKENGNCWDCGNCRNCRNCRNCLFCKNLKNETNDYWICNVKVSKEEFEAKKKELGL